MASRGLELMLGVSGAVTANASHGTATAAGRPKLRLEPQPVRASLANPIATAATLGSLPPAHGRHGEVSRQWGDP